MSAVVNLGHLIYTLWYLATLFLEVRDYVILVSAQGPNLSFFFFRGTFIQLGGLLGQGLGLRLGPGLDNNNVYFQKSWGHYKNTIIMHYSLVHEIFMGNKSHCQFSVH